MKLLLPSLALLVLSAPADEGVALRFEPEDGTVLKRVFEAEAEYRLADSTTSVDGEKIDTGELVDYRTEFTERIGVTDTLRTVAGGRPTELVRAFDELYQENVDSEGDEESSATLSSPLEGRSVLFRWDEEEEDYAVEAADEEELDEDLAAWLAEDMDLRLVLPEGEVEPGDEWEIDPKLYLAFMWPSGLLDFRAEGEEVDDQDRALSRQTIERLAGSGSARLEEVREEDGERLAVIHVEIEVTTGSEAVLPEVEGDEEEGIPPRPELTVEIEIERTLEGTILWDLEHGHARSAELECEASRLASQSWTVTGRREGEEVSAQVEQVRLLEGTIRYTATFTREGG